MSDGIVPVELQGRVTVAAWAPEVYDDCGRVEPEQGDPRWMVGLLTARRRHHEAWHRWADDHGFTADERRQHWVGRRPVW